jgi:hypothetical protein
MNKLPLNEEEVILPQAFVKSVSVEKVASKRANGYLHPMSFQIRDVLKDTITATGSLLIMNQESELHALLCLSDRS